MGTGLDFLAVGDIVTDAFIELRDADEHTAHGTRELCVRFGDKIPYERVDVVPAVGNSPNATVCAHRLGLKSALAAHLGDDAHGKEMVRALKREGIRTKHLVIEKGRESNYHYVLRHKEERTILVKHHEYRYALPKLSAPPAWMYLSSLAENSLPFQLELASYAAANPALKLVFQPGTFQIKIGAEALAPLYRASTLFFCNKEEAERILEKKADDVRELLTGIRTLGPKIAVITDGPKGAYVYDGSEMWWGSMYPDPKPPIDRTGAGDSFSATFTAALALGKSLAEALQWGPINSMSVVQYIGAQAGLLTRDVLERYLKDAPADYRPKRL
jgi:sugar/nucleoside kinase (ribokinase family)